MISPTSACGLQERLAAPERYLCSGWRASVCRYGNVFEGHILALPTRRAMAYCSAFFIICKICTSLWRTTDLQRGKNASKLSSKVRDRAAKYCDQCMRAPQVASAAPRWRPLGVEFMGVFRRMPSCSFLGRFQINSR